MHPTRAKSGLVHVQQMVIAEAFGQLYLGPEVATARRTRALIESFFALIIEKRRLPLDAHIAAGLFSKGLLVLRRN